MRVAVPTVVLVATVGLGVLLFKMNQADEDPETPDAAVTPDLARSAANRAIKAREEAEQRVRELERDVKRLRMRHARQRDRLDRAERIFKENARLKREAQAREQYIIKLEGRVDQTRP
jgi:predicted RNase H-like nuclease (RuvC/YqgF family)